MVGTGRGSWIILFVSLVYHLGKKDTDLTAIRSPTWSLYLVPWPCAFEANTCGLAVLLYGPPVYWGCSCLEVM